MAKIVWSVHPSGTASSFCPLFAFGATQRPRARRHTRVVLVLCMLAGCFVRRVRSAFVVARIQSSALPSFSPPSSQLHGSQRINGDTSSASTDEEGGSDLPSSARRRTPRTGWNHNQPSEGSVFWQPGTEKKLSAGTSSNSNSLRTGWLHNASPRTDEQSKAKGGTKSRDGSSYDGPGPSVSLARQRLNDAMRERFRSDLDHRILAVAYHSTGTAVAAVTEHAIRVPLQHSSGSEDAKRLWRGGEAPATVEVFFSVVEKLSKENEWLHELQNQPLSPRERAELYVKNAALRDADSLCLFLQGGPGFGAPVPVAGLGLGKDSSWASAALDACGYSRIVLLDQRGTGRSTPVTKQWIEMNYPDLFLLDGDDKPTSTANTLEEWRAKDSDRAARVQVAVDQVTEYLSSFRCDSIVRDAELVRQALLLDPDDVAAAAADASQSLSRPTPRPWGGALGQSFGGFCLLSYLSSVEHPPRIALFTGGIPPMLTPLTEVYRKLWDRVKERSLRYYDMYPDDVPVVKNIVRRLLEEAPVLPSGGSLTARRFLQLGLRLGSAPPSFAVIHAMISSAFVPGSSTTLSRPFLKAIEMEQSFDDHPIYFWLHEPSCYADGNFSGATNWAAHRVYQELIASEDSEWDYSRTCLESDPRPVLWFGEHVFPWMAEDYGELKGAGLAAVAEALAQKADWGPLFDGNKIRECLASKRSRAAAAVYYEDMYVEFEASVKVAERGGPLEKCKLYITNEYQHSGLRDDGAKMFSKLYGMATGTVRTPS